MAPLRILVATLGLAGALLFGAAFAVSYARPDVVEETAAKMVRAEVERGVREQGAALAGGPAAAIAAGIAQRNEAEIAQLRTLLADSLHAKVARISAEMRDPDCACRETGAAGTLDWRTLAQSQAGERLAALIRAKYMDVAASLMREFRIVTAANTLVLLMLGIAVVVRRDARLHLLPPALILATAAAGTGYAYLFGQDWLHTIVFSDYVGFAYFAYLGIAAVFLGDVTLNRGRVSAQVINVGADAVGSTLTVLPC
jgi:hypothetical protein